MSDEYLGLGPLKPLKQILHEQSHNPIRDYWDALDAYYRDIGMTDDDAHDDWRERVRKFRWP